MIYKLLAVNSLFAIVGFLLTPSNAKYLLAGYNTMTEEERKQVAIQPLVRYFRKFHIVLGITNFLMCFILYKMVSSEVASSVMVLFPLLAYMFLIVKSNTFYKSKTTRNNK